MMIEISCKVLVMNNDTAQEDEEEKLQRRGKIRGEQVSHDSCKCQEEQQEKQDEKEQLKKDNER